MIMSYNTEAVDESLKTRGYEDLVRYKFLLIIKFLWFFGVIHDLMKFLKCHLVELKLVRGFADGESSIQW